MSENISSTVKKRRLPKWWPRGRLITNDDLTSMKIKLKDYPKEYYKLQWEHFYNGWALYKITTDLSTNEVWAEFFPETEAYTFELLYRRKTRGTPGYF